MFVSQYNAGYGFSGRSTTLKYIQQTKYKYKDRYIQKATKRKPNRKEKSERLRHLHTNNITIQSLLVPRRRARVRSMRRQVNT